MFLDGWFLIRILKSESGHCHQIKTHETSKTKLGKAYTYLNQDLMNGQFTMTSNVLETRTQSLSLSQTVQKISSPAGMVSVLTLMIG